MQTLLAGLFGVVFGAGLAISGMTNPAKVIGFLDLTGAWDPTLAFVMGAALLVSTACYAVARRRELTWLGLRFAIPTRTDLDASLIGGAACFGVGWGLVGLCPGPALASLYRGSSEVTLFVASMIAGIGIHRLLASRGGSKASSQTLRSIPH